MNHRGTEAQRKKGLWHHPKTQAARVAPLLMVFILASCSGGERIAKANDALRIKNLDLEAKVDDLTRRNKELEAELKRESAVPETLPEDIRANTPHVTGITIGKLSHARDDDRDGRIDTLFLYLQSTDGRARFVQMVGTVSVNVAILPQDADAVTIGRLSVNPTELREAYRSSITGTHYTIEVPIEPPDSIATAKSQNATVRVIYDDGLTGQSLSAEHSIALTLK